MKQESKEASTANAKVISSLIATSLGVIASLVSTVVAAADIFKVTKEIGAAVIVAIVAIGISAVFTTILGRRERGPAPVDRLKADFETAYTNALGKSAFHPERKESA